jgi:hypothetical protein
MPVVPVAYAIQAAAAPAPTDVAPSDFRLKPAAPADPAQRCPEPRPGEILVCGRRGQGQRLAPLAPPPGVHPKRELGVDLGGGRLGPAMRQVAMPNGRVSNRIMIEFKLPF